MRWNGLEDAVVGNEVGGSRNVLLDLDTGLAGQVLDEVADIGDVGDTLESHQVGGKTSNVGGGYNQPKISI